MTLHFCSLPSSSKRFDSNESHRKLLLLITTMLLCSNMGFAIIGGRPAPKYPFFVVVYVADHMCGGTLVKLDAVLTAAHCLYFDNEHRWASPLEIYVLHGDFSRPNNWKARYHSCDKIIVHYKYEVSASGGRNPFDVAVIKLEDKVRIQNVPQRTLLPLCRFDGYRRKRNLIGAAIGLGPISMNPVAGAERLMETSLEMIDCDIPELICYSIPRGTLMTDNDFGGPAVALENGTAVCLIGVSSFTLYSSVNNYYVSIFTPSGKLRHWMHRSFKYNFTDSDIESDQL